MERVLLWILAAGAVIGGLDLMLGNRLKLGERFREGLQLMGPMALSMAGILCLAPLLSRGLSATAAPLWRRMGLDPALLGSSFLAIDMGGYQLAVDLAADQAVGKYGGILVSAILGCTVSFTVPMSAGMVEKKDVPAFFRGILIGLGVMPLALIPGALACGVPFGNAVLQTLPILIFSLLLMAALKFAPEKALKGFEFFARLIQAASIIGLTAGAVQYIAGVTLIPGLGSAEAAMQVVGGIALVLLGSLPAAELLRRALKKPLGYVGRKMALNETSLTGLMVGFVSITPVLAMVKEMDARGKTMNAAFLVCAGSALSAHLGYTLTVEPALLPALLLTKGLSGLLAAAVALALTKNNSRLAQ